jgi:hypothetical protein
MNEWMNTEKQTGKDYDTAYSVTDNKIFINFDYLHSLIFTQFHSTADKHNCVHGW